MMKKCPSCGAFNPPEAVKCKKCGSDLPETVADPANLPPVTAPKGPGGPPAAAPKGPGAPGAPGAPKGPAAPKGPGAPKPPSAS
jgi:hypothetical protein